MSGDNDKPDELNLYKRLLESCRDTLIPDCRDTVHEGTGSPADAIAGPIGDGGWVCSEADTWVTELTTHCTGITGAFDDAIDVVRSEAAGEPDYVEADNWRGNKWSQTWAWRQQFLAYN